VGGSHSDGVCVTPVDRRSTPVCAATDISGTDDNGDLNRPGSFNNLTGNRGDRIAIEANPAGASQRFATQFEQHTSIVACRHAGPSYSGIY